MKHGKKQIIALDVDDVLMPCIPVACEVANKRGIPVKPEDIQDYGMSTIPKAWREAFLAIMNEESFYLSQTPFPGAVEMVEELVEAGHEVTIASAVPPILMSARSRVLLKNFTSLNPRDIMLGARKDLLHVDFLLDDAIHNVATSKARYPVVYNQTWNVQAENYLRVKNYNEFVSLVEAVSLAPSAAEVNLNRCGHPGILCLVGPSASGKSFICDELVKNPLFRKVCSVTTRAPRPGEIEGNEYHFVTREAFSEYRPEDMVESTVYCGRQYGITKKEVQDIWHDGRIAIKPMDINGALACKRAFGDRCVTVFVRRNKADIIHSLLERDIPNKEKTERLMSLDSEMENESLCDWTVVNNGSCEAAVQQVMRII